MYLTQQWTKLNSDEYSPIYKYSFHLYQDITSYGSPECHTLGILKTIGNYGRI